MVESKSDHENAVLVLNEELKAAKEKANQVSTLQLDIQELRAENENQQLVASETIKKRASVYELKITVLESEIGELKTKLEAHETAERPSFESVDTSKWTEEINGLNEWIAKLEGDLSEKELELRSAKESEHKLEESLHRVKVLKQLNDTLIADKTNSNTAIQELEDRVEGLAAEKARLEAEVGACEAKIVQLESQCKLYEETVVIERREETSGVSWEQFEKVRSELQYECGVADDLKRQLQAAVEGKEEAVRRCEQLEVWHRANSVSSEEYVRVSEECEAVGRAGEGVCAELRVVKEEWQAVELVLREAKESGSEATANLVRERDSLNGKVG